MSRRRMSLASVPIRQEPLPHPANPIGGTQGEADAGPLSEKQKILQGTFRADQSQDIPSPPIEQTVKDPPAHLGRNGKKLWENLVWDMTSLGLITSIDWATFELCCSSYDLYMEAKELIYKPMNKETNRPRRQSLAEYLDHGDTKAIRILNQS